MSDRPVNDSLGLIQFAIRVGYGCTLVALIAVVTFFIVRFIISTG